MVFLDESGIDTRLTRSHARAVRGERAVGKVPWGHWQRLTVLGALGLDGVTASMSIAAATNTAVFLASDHASAMTGTVVNLSGGAVVD